MNVIYAHITDIKLPFSSELNECKWTYDGLPDYSKYSIDNTAKLGDNVVVINDQDVTDSILNQIIEIYNICKSEWPSYYKDPFWLLTLMRLYVVYYYVKENNISEFVHMEYDNITYNSCDHLQKLPPGIYFTQVGPQCGSAGFMFCNSLKHFEKFISRLNNLLSQGQNRVKQFTSYDHISEMIMIDLIHTHSNDINYLPLLPSDEYYDILNYVYDGASYGQFLGGTNNGHSKGWYGSHHYVGQQIQQKNITKINIPEDSRPLQPVLDYKHHTANIFNLHMHNKNVIPEFI